MGCGVYDKIICGMLFKKQFMVPITCNTYIFRLDQAIQLDIYVRKKYGNRGADGFMPFCCLNYDITMQRSGLYIYIYVGCGIAILASAHHPIDNAWFH